MADRIQLRRDTAANWTNTNPTLAQGELGLELDTSQWKSGDGTTAWTSLAYLGVGPAGPAGPAGAPGGITLRNGEGAPSSGLGIDGDFYIDTLANNLYGPKASGVWPSPVSIVGPTGATGPAGAAGATGPAGPGLPAGGTAGQIPSKIDATDYNVEWVDAPTGGGSGDLSIDGGSPTSVYTAPQSIDGGSP